MFRLKVSPMYFRNILAFSALSFLVSCGGDGNIIGVSSGGGTELKFDCGVTSSVSSFVHPADNATGVPLDTIVSVTSSLEIDSGLLSSTPLILKQADAIIDVDTVIADNYIAIVPNSFLEPSTTYTVEADSSAAALLSSAGISVDSPFATFTTGDCSVVGDDLEMYRVFKAEILEHGPEMHVQRKARESSLRDTFSEVGVGTLYYDATYGYVEAQKHMRLTGDIYNLFGQYASLANDIYQENVEKSSPGGAAGLPTRRAFPVGIYRGYETSIASLEDSISAISVLRNASFSRIGNPGDGLYEAHKHEGYIRETAYYLETLLYYERIGAAQATGDNYIELINIAKNALLGHLSKLTSHDYTEGRIGGPFNYKFSQPFMTGLGADALVDYVDWIDERRGQLADSSAIQTRAEAVAEILPVIEQLGDWLFEASIHVVTIPNGTLSIGDVVTFTSNVEMFDNGGFTRERVLIDRDFDDSVIKQAMPFAEGDTPSFTVNGPAGVVAHSIEEVVTMWIPTVGGSPGAWTDTGDAGLGGAFRYVVPTTPTVGETNPAPDLNMLMLPMFGFLYSETCDPKWKERGDQVFDGGVKKASWQLGKQYNQQHKNSYSYINLRRANCP